MDRSVIAPAGVQQFWSAVINLVFLLSAGFVGARPRPAPSYGRRPAINRL